jgi:hypothetical protein
MGVMAAAMTATPPTARAQIAVVRFEPLEELLGDVKLIVAAIQPNPGRAAAMNPLAGLEDPSSLKGLDRKRPIEAHFDLDPKSGAWSPSIFIPVTDGRAFLGASRSLSRSESRSTP